MNSSSSSELRRQGGLPFGGGARYLRRFANHGVHDRLRLVCLPWCGAGASVYRRFLSHLPGDVALYSAQLPGREESFALPRLRRMAEVVACLLPEVAALAGDAQRPLVLFGHSMGAVVAFELALALTRGYRLQPALLIASGHDSPALARRSQFQWHSAPDGDLIANIRALGGTPEAVLEDEALMRTLLPLMKADYEVLETYAPRSGSRMLQCPVIACAGRHDREVTLPGLEAWRELTCAHAAVQLFDGGHFYLHDTPAPLLAALLHWTAALPGVRAATALQS